MATVTLISIPPVWQAYGETAWNVGAGDRHHFYGWSVRPFQARDSAYLVGVAAHSDNNLNQSTDLVVRLTLNQPPAGGGGLVHLRGVKVT